MWWFREWIPLCLNQSGLRAERLQRDLWLCFTTSVELPDVAYASVPAVGHWTVLGHSLARTTNVHMSSAKDPPYKETLRRIMLHLPSKQQKFVLRKPCQFDSKPTIRCSSPELFHIYMAFFIYYWNFWR